MDALFATFVVALVIARGYADPVKTYCPTFPDGSDYHSADTLSCNIFYKCFYGSWIKFDCPAGLVFRADTSYCDYPDNYRCEICPVPCATTGTCDAANSKCVCSTGYGGADCSVDIDECSAKTATCSRICTNTPGSYICSCDPGYTLSAAGYCSDINECALNTDNCPAGCFNTPGGYTCGCPAGYNTAADGQCVDIDECTTGSETCADICNNTPGSYTCDCGTAGYILSADGRSCEAIPGPKITCSPSCQNGGTCVLNPATNTNICQCEFGFIGTACEIFNLCAPINCQNGGVCSIVDGQGMCTCPLGTSGPQCATVDPNFNPCQTSGITCLNGGQCVARNGVATCLCASPYIGSYCEQTGTVIPPDTCNPSILCQNGGKCVQVNNAPTCFCPQGYGGLYCEIALNPCCYISCQNGGQCAYSSGYLTCLCPNGYTGPRCEQVTACLGYTCQNGGQCVLNGGLPTCNCPDGYTGAKCETPDPCGNVVCLNNGVCKVGTQGDLTCECPTGYTGYFCELEVDCSKLTCLNGGQCGIIDNQAVCDCPTGTSGEFCEKRAACGAKDSPCLNGGQCTDSEQGFVCTCTFGWTGANCQQKRTCATSLIQCENGGQCTDTADGAKCSCPSSYTGSYCETVLDGCGGCQNGGVCKVSEIFPINSTEKSCACPAGFTGALCETAADCTIPCSPLLGKGGDRYQVLVFPDLTSPNHVYVCREGLLQRVNSCPDTRYNIYTTGCLTNDQMIQATLTCQNNYYPQ
ncbi:unnamed protein product [Lymnaea stagnalis]|uniref:Uncharacterized protein n=1 Tax=Lymnaea stagnalis TaxID=6523 RepID=A0AAV2HG07_LYMST